MFFFVHKTNFMAKVERVQAGFKMLPRTVIQRNALSPGLFLMVDVFDNGLFRPLPLVFEPLENSGVVDIQTELVAVLWVGFDLDFGASNIRVFLFCWVVQFLSGIEYAGFAVKQSLDCSLRYSNALTIKNCRHEQL